MSELVKSTAREARERAGRIRVGMVQYLHTLADVAAAYAARDWLALGYESWESYVDGEYGAERLKLSQEHRQKAVAELRLAGMSTRAIGVAIGTSEATVRRDIAGASDDAPDEIIGADGKTYAAARTTPQTTTEDVPPSSVDPAAGTFAGPAAASPAPGEGGAGAGEAIPEHTPEEAAAEWCRRFHERAADVRAGREPFETFVADFPREHLDICGGPEERAVLATLSASSSQPDPIAAALAEARAKRDQVEQHNAWVRDLDEQTSPEVKAHSADLGRRVAPVISIAMACEFLLERVQNVDPELAVAEAPEQLLGKLAAVHDALAFLTRVADALKNTGVPE